MVMYGVEEVVEEVAEEFYHSAENVLQDAEEKTKAYVLCKVSSFYQFC